MWSLCAQNDMEEVNSVNCFISREGEGIWCPVGHLLLTSYKILSFYCIIHCKR